MGARGSVNLLFFIGFQGAMLLAAGVAAAQEPPSMQPAPTVQEAPGEQAAPPVAPTPPPQPAVSLPQTTAVAPVPEGLVANQPEPPRSELANPDIAKPDVAKPDIAKTDHLDALQMFRSADPIVKSVMLVLASASVLAWTVLIVMWTRIGWLVRQTQRSLRLFSSAASFIDGSLLDVWGAPQRMVRATIDEIDKSARSQSARRGDPGVLSGADLSEPLIERVGSAMAQIEAREARSAATGLGLLASIGSTGPFVGLFGTVWGIMHSFVSIANTGTTNLSVVAPGIAEALLATAIGLVAAIPAVLFYNILTRRGSYYRGLLAEASSILLRHLSRDLERANDGVQMG